jgi:acetylornithine deacetylase/succinyl-diaminopimelate desuccinylase-like protein
LDWNASVGKVCNAWFVSTIAPHSAIIAGVPGKTAVIMTLKGTNSSLPSLVLNSHIDVVPVFAVRQGL